MTTGEMSTVVSKDVRRYTIVNLKQVNQLPLRNVLQTFDRNGDGKIDISELQKMVYWYGLWKYASIGLCLIVMTLVWATFGLTIWALDRTKDCTVTDTDGDAAPDRRRLELSDLEAAGLNQNNMGGWTEDFALTAVEAGPEKIQEFQKKFDEFTRRRLAAPDLHNFVTESTALEIDPNPVGGKPVGTTQSAVQIAKPAVSALTAAFEEFSRRRLSDSDAAVNLISSVGANLSNFGIGGQASGSSDAAVAEGENEDPDHAQAHDVFRRRRLAENDLVDAFNTVSLNLAKSGERVVGDATNSFLQAAADAKVDDELEEKILSYMHERRRLSDQDGIFGAFSDVGFNLHDNGGQVADAAASLFEEAAENVDPERLETMTSFLADRIRRRLLEKEPLAQTERRRLESFVEALDRVSKGDLRGLGYDITVDKNAAIHAAWNEAYKAAHQLQSNGLFRTVDSPRRRVQDESSIETERRRLQTVGDLDEVSLSVMQNGINDYQPEDDQANSQLASLVDGVSESIGGMLEEESEEFSPARRRLSANRVVGNLGNTAILSVDEGGFEKDIQRQLDQAVTALAEAAGPIGLADELNLTDGKFVGVRRRLADFKAFVERALGASKFDLKENFSHIPDSVQGAQTLVDDAHMKDSEKLLQAVTDLDMAARSGENRRRLGDWLGTVEDLEQVRIMGINGMEKISDKLKGEQYVGNGPMKLSEEFDKLITSYPGDRRRLESSDSELLDTLATAFKSGKNSNLGIEVSDADQEFLSELRSQLGISAAEVAVTGAEFMDVGRRRLQNKPLGYFSKAVTGREDKHGISNNSAFPQSNASQVSAPGGTTTAQAANDEKNKVVTKFGRRRLEADDIVKNILSTDLLTTVQNDIRNSEVDQKEQISSAFDMAIKKNAKLEATINGGDYRTAVADLAAGMGRRRLQDELENVATVDMGLTNPGYSFSQEAEQNMQVSEDDAPLENDADMLVMINNFDRRRLEGLEDEDAYKYVATVDFGLVDQGIKNVQKAGEAVESGSAGRVPEGLKDIIGFRRRLQDLGGVGLNLNDVGIGAGLQAAENIAVILENAGTGPEDVEEVVIDF